MTEEPKPPYRRQILDDLFDAYVILGKGTYVSLYDVVGQMTRYSPASVDLFGLVGEYVPSGAMNWSDWVHPEDRSRYEKVMSKLIQGTAKHYDLHYRVRIKDGSYTLMRFVGSILRNEKTGKPELIGGITINEGLMEYTDPLTVLRNQYGFFQDIAAVMELKKNCTILMIGISKMSSINEAQGYSYGNKVLQQIGWLLRESIGFDGTIYRFEGAKFGFLTETLTPEQVAEKYEDIRHSLLNGLQIDNIKQTLMASGGMMSISGKTVDEQAIFNFLSYTCRESKLHKNGRLVNFNGTINRDTQDSLEMIDEIRNNILIDHKGFYLQYLASINSSDERPGGAEAILKWRSERFGDVDASEFMPILESDFVFEELGYWVLRRAMIDGKKFLEKDPNFIIGVDIVQVQLEDEFFTDEVVKLAEQTQFPLENLCLVLTRTCRMLESDFLKNKLNALRNKGVSITIDDFGSGLGSIDFLRELAPDYIKFDQKYMLEFEIEESRQVVRCLSELAAIFGTTVCVKGIDSKQMLNVIRQYTVSILQGDYYAPPLPLGEFMELFFPT